MIVIWNHVQAIYGNLRGDGQMFLVFSKIWKYLNENYCVYYIYYSKHIVVWGCKICVDFYILVDKVNFWYDYYRYVMWYILVNNLVNILFDCCCKIIFYNWKYYLFFVVYWNCKKWTYILVIEVIRVIDYRWLVKKCILVNLVMTEVYNFL